MALQSIRKGYMGKKRLHLQKNGDIFYLELTSPPANQTDRLFFQELADIIPALKDTRNIRGMIIYGRGRHFSSGADINELKNQATQKDNRTSIELMNRSVDTYSKLAKLPYPVVAAVQGCCMGSGLELTLTCDYRVATKYALFSLPETTFGLMPGCGGTIRLPQLVGRANATRMILSGGHYLAAEALKMGLINCIVDKKDLLPISEKIISTLPPHN